MYPGIVSQSCCAGCATVSVLVQADSAAVRRIPIIRNLQQYYAAPWWYLMFAAVIGQCPGTREAWWRDQRDMAGKVAVYMRWNKGKGETERAKEKKYCKFRPSFFSPNCS
jgi:hypothetical protein